MNPNDLKAFTEAAFALIFHAFIIAGILYIGVLIVGSVKSAKNSLERLVRGVAMATGVFVYGSARAMGVSLTAFISSAVDSGTWFGFVTAGTLAPAIVGVLTAKFVVAGLQRATFIAMRVIIFAGSLLLLQFADLYIETGLRAGLAVTRQFAPNLVFLACVGIYVVFQFHPRGFNKEDLDPR